MSTSRRPPEPFDEQSLRSLFARVELPAEVEAAWRERAADATPAKGLRAARRFRRGAWLRRATQPWARVLAVGIAATATAGVVGVVAANRPTALPQPDTDRLETVTSTPSTPPSSGPLAPPPSSATDSGSPATPPPAGGPGAGPGTQAGRGAGPGGAPAGPAPARGPLADWPDAGNAGIPAGTRLSPHGGDLHVTQPGAIVADQRVTGTVYVEAPDVTLRRVQANGTVRQLAPRLRVEDSDISGGLIGIQQAAAGLTVQRSNIHDVSYAVVVTADTLIVDCFLPGSSGSRVLTNGNTSGLTVRHNVIGGAVEITDQNGPVTGVAVDTNQLTFIWAPSGAASHDIRVTGNQFHRARPDDVPVSGWNAQAPGNSWTGNVWFGTSEAANP